eukprot:scaffold97468_cov39-Phaeocystis_antarctica.AAC.1
MGYAYSAQLPLSDPRGQVKAGEERFEGHKGKAWEGRTGTSFLPEETQERAAAGNPVEQAKVAKDATTIFNTVYEYAAAIRSGEMDWKDVEKAWLTLTLTLTRTRTLTLIQTLIRTLIRTL